MMLLNPIFAALIVIYPQAPSDPPPHCPVTKGDTLSDASPVMGLVRCKSTKAEVEARFGELKPVVNAVGEYDYHGPNGSLATFFFDQDGLLLRTLVYAEPSPKSN